MKTYDLLVIGAGPGGTPAAMAAAQFGKSVLLVDSRGELGGECLFEGCIPSKVLENAANRYMMVKEASSFHIKVTGDIEIDWKAVLADKEALLQKRAAGARENLKRLPTLTFKQGKALFIDTHTAMVDDEEISFKHAIIATGARAMIPPFNGSGMSDIWTNADVFKTKEIPKEILFIGAGAISCELVQMFQKLGTKCHILERGARILKRIDEGYALLLQQKMQASGITIDFHVDIERIEKSGEGFEVFYTQEGEKKSLSSKHVLVATGRHANVEDLALEKAGVNYTQKGIVVDKTLQTSQENIYAVGDCNIGPKFAHWASYEAGIAVHNIYAPHKHETDIKKLSWVLFSDPQIASAGLSEAEAQAEGIDVVVERYDYQIDARAQIDKQTLGALKFVINKADKTIIGVQILSEDASSLSGEASLIVAAKMKSMDLLNTIHPHPTLSESFGFLAKNIFFKSMAHGRK